MDILSLKRYYKVHYIYRKAAKANAAMNASSLMKTDSSFHLSFDAEVPCLVMAWHGYHTSSSFRVHNEEVLALLAERRATRILCDIRDFILIHGSEQDWLTHDWLPRAMALGLRTCAIVTPLYYFNRVAVETVAGRVDQNALQIKYFETEQAARCWLRSSP
jgi:hypothetical protein